MHCLVWTWISNINHPWFTYHVVQGQLFQSIQKWHWMPVQGQPCKGSIQVQSTLILEVNKAKTCDWVFPMWIEQSHIHLSLVDVSINHSMCLSCIKCTSLTWFECCLKHCAIRKSYTNGSLWILFHLLLFLGYAYLLCLERPDRMIHEIFLYKHPVFFLPILQVLSTFNMRLI